MTVRLSVPLPVQVRLDRLLAQELGVSRSRLPLHADAGGPLGRPALDGQVVRVRGTGLRPPPPAAPAR